jgi:hypothetical protein
VRSQLPVVLLVGSRWVLERHVHSREDSDLLTVRAQPVKLEELSDRDVDPKPSDVFAVVRPTTPSADLSPVQFASAHEAWVGANGPGSGPLPGSPTFVKIADALTT